MHGWRSSAWAAEELPQSSLSGRQDLNPCLSRDRLFTRDIAQLRRSEWREPVPSLKHAGVRRHEFRELREGAKPRQPLFQGVLPALFEPYLLAPDVKVRNLSTGEERVFPAHDLPLGVDTVFEAGAFYEQPQLAMYYHCDGIEGDVATLILVESFQLGQLIQARLTQKTIYAKHYVKVSDEAVLARLQRRLDGYRGRT